MRAHDGARLGDPVVGHADTLQYLPNDGRPVLLLELAIAMAVSLLGFPDPDVVQKADGKHDLGIAALRLAYPFSPLRDLKSVVDATVVVSEMIDERFDKFRFQVIDCHL